MGCGGSTTRVEPIKGPIDVDDDFDGPLKDRSCRDVIFLILFIACLGGMGYVSYLGMLSGNPNRLIYGVDSWGNVCNQKNEPLANVSRSGRDTTGLMNMFFFSLTATGFAADKPRLCVKQCPPEDLLTNSEIEQFAVQNDSRLCFYDYQIHEYPSILSNDSGYSCPDAPVLKTHTVMHKCIPDVLIEIVTGIFNSVTSILDSIDTNMTSKLVEDIELTWEKILHLCGMAFGIGLVMIILMRFLAAILIWTMVVGLALGSLSGAGYCWYQWYMLKTAAAAEDVLRNWLIYAGVSTGVAVIICLILLVMRSRIALVVQLFREAGKALGKMPLLLIQPLWTLIIYIGALGGLGYIFLWLLTSGHPVLDSATGFVNYEDDKLLYYLKWYFLFGAIWLLQFIVACQEVVIAGAIASWFFTRDKKKVGCCGPILTSIGRLLRYHLGSVAFGSFLIALVKFIRLVLAYVQGRLRGRGGKLVDFFLKCLQCCLWCFEKFLKFLNRNAYIEIAIYGYGFCKAAQKAFSLIVSNALRVAAINSVGDFVLFVGKCATTAAVVAIGLFYLETDTLNYVWAPLLLVGIFSFLIAHCFFSVYEMAIDTIFLCFCEDVSRNDGITKPYYMSKDLMNFVNKSATSLNVGDGKRNKKETSTA